MAFPAIFKKNLEKSIRFKQMQEDLRLQKTLEERQKSSNERELDRFYEEEREKTIKRNLEEFRQHRRAEAQQTTVLAGDNQFKGKGNMMSGKASILVNNNALLNSKATKSKGMFFK